MAWVSPILWPFLRVLAMFSSAPLFSMHVIPMRAKIGLAFFVALSSQAMLGNQPVISLTGPDALAAVAQQVVVGIAIGFAVRLVFSSVELAGEVIGLQMGLGFATLYDASVPGMIPVIGQYLGIVVSLAFLAVDGHLVLFSTLIESFQVLPLAPLSAAPGLRALVLWCGNIFSYSLALSLPLLAALLITNVALGILTRAAPQLNIFAVGFPLTILIGILVLYLSLPYFAPAFERMFIEGFTAMLRVAAALR